MVVITEPVIHMWSVIESQVDSLRSKYHNISNSHQSLSDWKLQDKTSDWIACIVNVSYPRVIVSTQACLVTHRPCQGWSWWGYSFKSLPCPVFESCKVHPVICIGWLDKIFLPCLFFYFFQRNMKYFKFFSSKYFSRIKSLINIFYI